MATTVKCPTCQRSVPWVPASKFKPFCSERCRLIDLGDWLDENHRIPEPAGDGVGDGWLEPGADGGGEGERRH
jgi:endogenous inhibitor of DNA gyrase (YacG/DUF329 family)